MPVKRWLVDEDLIEDDEIDMLAYLHHRSKTIAARAKKETKRPCLFF